MQLRSGVLTSLFLSLLCIAMPAAALTPVHLLSLHYGGTSYDALHDVAIDASNNIIVTGGFQGTASFGGSPLGSLGSFDIILAKYDGGGNPLWSERFGSTNSDMGYDVDVDASGNIYVTGIFSGTVNFGGSDLASAGSSDVFLAKYNSSGVHQWSQRFGSTGLDEAYGLEVTNSGVFITGSFVGTVNFGGANLVSAGQGDAFLACYSLAGVHQWSQRFGGSLGDAGQALIADASGHINLVATFFGTADFGGGNFVSAGASDIVLAQYSAAAPGLHQWSQRFGGSSTDMGFGVATDMNDNIYITGSFMGTVDFGTGPLVDAGGGDIYLARYSPTGSPVSSRRFGGVSPDVAYHVVCNPHNDVLITGYFSMSVDFGGGNLTSSGGTDIFIAKYDQSGSYRWARSSGGTDSDYGRSIAIDTAGNAWLGGYFMGSANFGGSTFVSLGSTDFALAKYWREAMEPRISTISDIGNDQGRQVKIRFENSGFDNGISPTPVVSYELYRRDDPAPATAASAPAMRADGWTQVGAVAAHWEESYGIDAPTIGDSTFTSGQYYSVFYVRAATADPGVFWDSPIDSGYSLDNLAPGVPQEFTFNQGQMSWVGPTAADFDYYTVYGSNSDDFGAAALVDYCTDPSLTVTGKWYVYYYVTATDFAGNEGMPARVNTLSNAGGPPTPYVLSVTSYPNPFNPGTTVRYTVPARGRVTVSVYDARGMLVTTLVRSELRAAGAHSVSWEGRTNEGARATSGVYFIRVEHPSGVRTHKVLLLK